MVKKKFNFVIALRAAPKRRFLSFIAILFFSLLAHLSVLNNAYTRWNVRISKIVHMNHIIICDISPDIYQMKLLIRFYFHQKEFSALYKQTAIIYCKKEMYDYETEMKMVRRSLSLQFNQKNKGTSGLMEPLPSGLQQVDYTSARTGLEIENQWQSSLNQQKNIGIFQGFAKFFSTLVEKLIIGMFQV